MSSASSFTFVQDWNYQHILCETIINSSTQSCLNTDSLQIICEFAYDINPNSWVLHATTSDHMIMEQLQTQIVQDQTEEYLSFETWPQKEFANQLCQAQEKLYWSKYQWDSQHYPPIQIPELKTHSAWKSFVQHWHKRGIDMSQQNHEYPLTYRCLGHWNSIYQDILNSYEWSDPDCGYSTHIHTETIPHELLSKQLLVQPIPTHTSLSY